MKTLFKICLLILSLSSCGYSFNHTKQDSEEDIITHPASLKENTPDLPPDDSEKKVQLAILLDTSGSMSGLIEQAKNQLWEIVNKLSDARDKEGAIPKIEIALYHYGNDGLSVNDNYVKKLYDFTSELDEISEKLFALSTNGGSEYCGAVIDASIEELEWNLAEGNVGILYIAGNEGFNQGPKPYIEVCKKAKEKGVVVNTIFCGDYLEGINTFWQTGATLTGGQYLNIDSDATITHISTPFDSLIMDNNTRLNDTYISYGDFGSIKKEKQIREDTNALIYGLANASKRVLSKSGNGYFNSKWDVVDAYIADSTLNIDNLTNLPEEMQSLTTIQKRDYIKKKKDKRDEIKSELAQLKRKRQEYVTNFKKENNNSEENQLNDVVIGSIVNQMKSKGYSFIDEN